MRFVCDTVDYNSCDNLIYILKRNLTMWFKYNFLNFTTSFIKLHIRQTSTSPEAISKLTSVLEPKRVLTSEAVREHHGKDEGPFKSQLADVVVFPQTTDEVRLVAQVCHENKVPMIPFGTGTGLEGGVNALHGGVCIDLTNMNRIFNLNNEDFNVTVEPGVTRTALNSFLRESGTWFPVDPGADASLCGMAATSASGTNAVRYGTMKENVLNMEVVLADGTIIHTAGKDRCTRKSSAGYNLTSLFVGSEGTLGIITNVSLKLHPIPEQIAACVCSFPTISHAVTTILQLLQLSIPLAKIELLDQCAMNACNSYSKTDFPEQPALFLEFHGSSPEIKHQKEVTQDVLEMNNGKLVMWAVAQEERSALWKARHGLFYSCLALRPGSKAVITDVCVPISKLPDSIDHAQTVIKASGIIGPIFGHVGDGNFHAILLCDLNVKEEVELAKEVAAQIADKALSLGGTCTGEHGIGQGKIKFLERQVGPECCELMKTLKLAFDPHLLLNRGKVLNL